MLCCIGQRCQVDLFWQVSNMQGQKEVGRSIHTRSKDKCSKVSSHSNNVPTATATNAAPRRQPLARRAAHEDSKQEGPTWPGAHLDPAPVQRQAGQAAEGIRLQLGVHVCVTMPTNMQGVVC